MIYTQKEEIKYAFGHFKSFFYLDIKLIALLFNQIVKNLVFAELTHFETLHGFFYEDRSLCTNSYKIIQRSNEI